jgi:hypothetical protein
MTLDPSKVITLPYIDPQNTFRASTVEEMYSVAWSNAPFEIVYEAGISPTYAKTLALRNNTISNRLQFQLTVPNWLAISTNTFFILEPNQTVLISIGLNEEASLNLLRSNVKHTTEDFKITVTPLAVNGPVSIIANLQTLTV